MWRLPVRYWNVIDRIERHFSVSRRKRTGDKYNRLGREHIVGMAGSPLRAESAAPTGVVALPFFLINLRCVLRGDPYSRFVWINLGLVWISI